MREPVPRVAAEPQLRMTAEIQERPGLVARPEQQHQHTSEYRHIKRQVVAEIRENPDERIVLVASALAGEGKSFTSANLARSMALEPDFTVLLVDADVHKPKLTTALGLTGRKGLIDALVDPGMDPESQVQTTDIEGLSVLPAGTPHPNATEYFASERMRGVLDRLLSVPNRIVVIDSLPLLLTTEARALTPHAHQLLMVVRAESTPQAAVKQALALVGDSVQVKLILNAVVTTHVSRYLGYGFDYQYSASPTRTETP